MKQFYGVGTALITPFGRGGAIDYKTLGNLMDFQISSKVDYLVIAGTTGEGVTLADDELTELLRFCREHARGRIPVVAGCGGSNTAAVTERIEQLNSLKLDGYLVVTPPYNKPMQAGLLKHYAEISKAASKYPVIVYNVPGRTAGKIYPETLAELAADYSNIVAVKEAGGDLGFCMQLYRAVKARRSDFVFLSGDDSFALPLISLGYNGVISVASNEVPVQIKSLVDFAMEGNFEEARKLHYRLLPLMNCNFMESNPGPVKYAMSKMGFGDGSVRLPLSELSDTDTMDRILKELGIDNA
ncbi:MAG: 4-hydroxy-tetrahydrodipicolinate synthase [Oligoflexia bacterium]|nr:4-hydroxy-tetrahydrodipicolinate synthase [Oligoflexia bacterium]